MSTASFKRDYVSSSLACEWVVLPSLIAYPEAIELLKQMAKQVQEEEICERVLIGETEPIYTKGRAAQGWALLEPNALPVYEEDRGGSYSYYGPGVRLYAPILNLKKRGIRLSDYERLLVEWMVKSLTDLGVEGVHPNPAWPGAWVWLPKELSSPCHQSGQGHTSYMDVAMQMLAAMAEFSEEERSKQEKVECKVGSVGFYVENWISHLGAAVNYAANPAHMSGIRLCSLPSFLDVQSLLQLGYVFTSEQLDAAFLKNFNRMVNVEYIPAP